MLKRLTRLYDAYVDTYRGADGELPPMMELKYVHTTFVVKNAVRIADGEGFSPLKREAALAAALLHDTGRYEQLKRYDTFQDSKSVDHAVFSHDIVKSLGWLDAVAGAEKEAILKAVLYHNRRELPDCLDDLTETISHTVRDADKLDIFRIFEDKVAQVDWKRDSRVFWNLAISAPPNPIVIDCIANARPVDYRHIQSLADFVLTQVGWMVSGLHFATSRRLCREREHLAYRRNFLHQLTDSPSIDKLCKLAERSMVF